MRINFKNRQTQIIAECGLSHGGSLKKAKNFIKCVKENGADIVKFQTHIAETEVEGQQVLMEQQLDNKVVVPPLP